MDRSKVITGGCLCGHVRYEATGKPYNLTHCHCADCRRASGAPFVTWASFRREEFHLVSGTPREIHWEGRIRAFCHYCGTALIFLSGAEATEVDVTFSSFDDPACITPTDHTWVEDRLPWVHLSDDLPEHGRARPSPVS